MPFKIKRYTCHITHQVGSLSQSTNEKDHALALHFAMEAYCFTSRIISLSAFEYSQLKQYLHKIDCDFVDFMNEDLLRNNLKKSNADYIYIEEYLHDESAFAARHIDDLCVIHMHQLLQNLGYEHIASLFKSLSYVPWEEFTQVTSFLMNDASIQHLQYWPDNAWDYYQSHVHKALNNAEVPLMI